MPPVYVGPGAVVEAGARVGSLAVLGDGSRLGEGAVVENAVVGARATVGAGSVVVGSVVGDDAELGDGCELRNLAVVGPGASLGAATSSTTASASAPTSGSPTRRSASRERGAREPVRVLAPAGREAVGLGADLGRSGAYVGKLLFIRAGEALSLQYHEVKDESWLVHEGRARLELGQADDDELETVELVPATLSASGPARFIA